MSKGARIRAQHAREAARPEGAGAGTFDYGSMADAVQEAIETVTGRDGFLMCALYAAAGAEVATKLTGRRHMLMAGGVQVPTEAEGPDGLPPFTLVLDPREVAGEYHACFCETPRPGDRELMITDYSWRHFKTQVAKIGAPWEREPLPDWYHGTPTQAWNQHKVGYTPDKDTTAMVLGEVATDPGIVSDVVSLALFRLGDGTGARTLIRV